MTSHRTIQRTFHLIIVLSMLLGLLGTFVLPVRSEPFDHTFYVNTSEPMSPDTSPGDMICQTASGKCSLYAAIQESNAINGADLILFEDYVQVIEFEEDDCCLPPLSDVSDGTTIRGEGAVTLRHAGLVTPNQNDFGITILSDGNRVQGLNIEYFDYGIVVNSDGNIIGTDGDTYDDLSEGNDLTYNAYGIQIFGDDNMVAGNYAAHNSHYGIAIEENASGNLVGISDGVFQPFYNLVSDNETGITVRGNENRIAGNSVDNSTEWGISISGDYNIIGTNGNETYDFMEGNIVTNSGYSGINIQGDNNIIAGNYSGADSNSFVDANGNGLFISGANNLVGTNGDGISDELERNYLAGNEDDNLQIRGNDNLVYGNWIGVLPNGGGVEGYPTGIAICGGDDNVVGDVNPVLGNLIAYNWMGINVFETCGQATGNILRGNSIRDNLGLGVDLGMVSIQPNDPGDPDTGANDLQNYPELTAALRSSVTSVLGTFNSVPNQEFTLDFYASTTCTNGTRSGEQYLDTLVVTTDAEGNALINHELPQVDVGKFITTLATNQDLSTSEFSSCTQVVQAPIDGAVQVNSIADVVDQDPDDSTCDTGGMVGDEPECTLRAAIQQTNASPGADVILLPAGNYVLSIAGLAEQNAANGDLDINDDLTILGAGPAVTVIDANSIDRVFEISPLSTATVTMTHVTVQGGGMMASGRAININGELNLLNSVVSHNLAGSNGTLYVQPAGSLYVEGSTIYSNTVTGDGGGIYAIGSVEVVNSTISGNQAGGNGGGLYLTDDPHSLASVTITENTADADGSDLGDGGGVYNASSEVTVQNSVIAQNRDLSGDGEQDGSDPWDCAGDYISNGYNFVSDDQGCSGFDNTGDLTSGFFLYDNYIVYSANLAPLADNGGSTPTHMPDASFNLFVIDRGNPAEPGSEPAACPVTDQRGIPRSSDGDGDGVEQCDKGSVEFAMPVINVLSPEVLEGEDANFVFSLTPSSALTVTLQYTATASSATPVEDFMPISGTLTFAPGDNVYTVTVQTLKDTLNEGDETFYLELGHVENAVLLTPAGVGVIHDENPLPTISILDLSVDEGTGGKTQAVFIVTLSFSSTTEVKAWFATASGTAKTEDFDPLAGWLTIPAYTAQATITIEVIGDDLPEEDEIFSVTLSDLQGARPADDRALCTIRDDDGFFTGYLFLPMVVK